MLKKLTEEDFFILREPFASGRQSPRSLALAFMLSLFILPLMFFFTHIMMADETIYPKVDALYTINLWSTGILMLLALVFAIERVYMKMQKIQYFVSIVISQNVFGVSWYLSTLYSVGRGGNVTEKSLIIFTMITLLFALLIFVFTFIRFYKLLLDGQYRKGSKKDKQRSDLEASLGSFVPKVIGASTALVMLVIPLWQIFDIEGLSESFFIAVYLLLFFVMIFVLPEQLVLLYCKFRFESFNYNEEGNLNELTIERKRGRKRKKRKKKKKRS